MTTIPARPLQRRRYNRLPHGVTLIELMVALVIGVVLSGAAVMIYANSKHAFAVQDNTSHVQENGRFALHLLKEDIRLAGYWGLNYESVTISETESITFAGTECTANWVYDSASSPPSLRPDIGILNNTNATYTACIPNNDYKSSTDVLTVRHASSEPVAAADILAGNVYVSTSLTSGSIFIADADGAIDTGVDVGQVPVNTYRLVANTYYIRPWSVSSDPTIENPPIPTLVREVIRVESGSPKLVAEPLIEYVEDLQVTFGLDTNADGDVDRYDNDGIDTADIEDVMTVIVEILVRAPTPEADYTNTRTYQLGDRTHAPNDGFRRQVFRQTIFVRNWARLGSV